MNEKDKKVAYFLNQVGAYLCIFFAAFFYLSRESSWMVKFLEGFGTQNFKFLIIGPVIGAFACFKNGEQFKKKQKGK